MTDDLCDLMNGDRMDVCTFSNGTLGAFRKFFDELSSDSQTDVLCLIERVAAGGIPDNSEIFRPFPVEVFGIAYRGVFLSCFRSGRKFVVCAHGVGPLTQEAIDATKLMQTQFLSNSKQTITQKK